MKIFGLSGTNGSGKDILAKLLEREYGFLNVSATDLLGDELTRQGKEHTRENKSALSAEWRRQFGMGVIVDKAVFEFKKYPAGTYAGLIVGSLRHPGETDRVHELGGLQLWIDADSKVRYARITGHDRGRAAEDNKTYEEFLADEAREMTPEGDAATLNMAGVKEKADIFIDNNESNVETFEAQVRDVLKRHL